MFTADAFSLLEPDYSEVELISSSDEDREAWAALWRGREQEARAAVSRKRKREGSGRDDSKRQAIGLVGHCSNQQLATTSLDATCQGIFSDYRCIKTVARITCLFRSFRMKIYVKFDEVTSLQLDEHQ